MNGEKSLVSESSMLVLGARRQEPKVVRQCIGMVGVKRTENLRLVLGVLSCLERQYSHLWGSFLKSCSRLSPKSCQKIVSGDGQKQFDASSSSNVTYAGCWSLVAISYMANLTKYLWRDDSGGCFAKKENTVGITNNE